MTIIKVDASDDILSIGDRINRSNSQRVLLVIPRKKRNYPDEPGLVILDRAVRRNGGQLGLVTRKSGIMEFAKNIGVKVFNSVTQAEREAWGDLPEKEDNAQRHGLLSLIEMRKELPGNTKKLSLSRTSKQIVFSILAVVFFLALSVFLPSAKVVIYPLTQSQELNLEVHASTDFTQSSLSGWIPAFKESFALTGEMVAVSSGSVRVGRTKATGEVVVANLTTQTITLPKGSVFTTTGQGQVKFISQRDVTIPDDGSAGTVPVEALNAGELGNVGIGEIDLLEGIAGSSLSVNNEIAFTGGSSVFLPAPNEEDYNRLYGKLMNDLREESLKQALTKATENYQLIVESVTLDEVIEETRKNPIGEASDTLSMTITARFSFLFFNPADLDKLMNDVMDLSIPENLIAAENGLVLKKIDKPEVISGNEIAWQVQAKRPIFQDYSRQELKRTISGKSVERTIDAINSEIPHYRSAEVQSNVDWWPYMPLLLNRIELEERVQNGG